MIINCPHCLQEIIVEDADSGKMECPLCRGHIDIERSIRDDATFPVGVAPQKSQPTEPARTPAKRTGRNAKVLREIRERSAYRTLRAVVNVVFWISAVFSGLLGALAIVLFASPSKELRAEFASPLVMSLGFSVLGLILSSAARQAAMLLIDIADCQLAARDTEKD